MSDQEYLDEIGFDDCSTPSPSLLNNDNDAESFVFTTIGAEDTADPNCSQISLSGSSEFQLNQLSSSIPSEYQLSLGDSQQLFSASTIAATSDFQPDKLIKSEILDEFQLNLTANRGFKTPKKAVEVVTQDDSDSDSNEVDQESETPANADNSQVPSDSESNFDEEFLVTPKEHFKRKLEEEKAELLARKERRYNTVGRTPIIHSNLEWSNAPAEPTIIPFTGRSGMKIKMELDATPYDYFQLIFNEELFNKLAVETNRYASQKIKKTYVSDKSRLKHWADVNSNDMRVYLAMWIHMGLIRDCCTALLKLFKLTYTFINKFSLKPEQADYWSMDPVLHTPQFGQQMRREKFQLITSNISFNHKEKDNGNDPLYKLRPIIDHVIKHIRNVYYPGKQVAIDESMINWRGRWHLRQYIKEKAHKFGMKMFMLAEPNGLVWNMIPYSGAVPDPCQLGQSGAIVIQLMEPLLGKGHAVYLDNFYNSVELSLELLRRKTYVTGTVRPDRKGLPTNVVGKTSPKLSVVGDMLSAQSNGIFVCKWLDKREVNMISTEFACEIVEAPNRLGRLLHKPNCVKQYNKYMFGIDKSDQMLSYYDILRKGYKWHRKLFFRLMDICVHNAWVMYNLSGASMDAKTFRLELVRGIYASAGPNRQQIPQSLPTETVRKPMENHKPMKGRTGRCIKCSDKNDKNSTSTTVCPGCPGTPHLCFKPGDKMCFLEHHGFM